MSAFCTPKTKGINPGSFLGYAHSKKSFIVIICSIKCESTGYSVPGIPMTIINSNFSISKYWSFVANHHYFDTIEYSPNIWGIHQSFPSEVYILPEVYMGI